MGKKKTSTYKILDIKKTKKYHYQLKSVFREKGIKKKINLIKSINEKNKNTFIGTIIRVNVSLSDKKNIKPL